MATPAQQTEVCVQCDQEFDDWQAYIRHMIVSGNHPHACATCGQEFQSEEGKQTHQRQAHPPDQSLICSGCHKEFTRCGSLVHHVEIDGCPVFRKLAFEKIRDANDDYYKKMGLPKKRNTATTTDVIDKAHTANASCVPSEVLEASPAPAGTARSEVGKVSAGPARRVQSEVDNVSAGPASHVTPRDIMTDFETPCKEAEYEEFKRNFPALKIQRRGVGSTDSVVTPMRPTGVNSPTKGKAEDDLVEMSPNRNVPKHNWPSLARLKQFNIAAGGAENMPWEKEAPKISPPLARSSKFSGTIPHHSSASKQPSNLRSPMLTHAEPDLGAPSKPSNILQPVQELKLGEQQLTVQAIESTAEETAPTYYHQYDPDRPGFNLEQYRNPYSKKYNCAFAGCSKLLNSSQALHMHLKSNAHLTDLCLCPFCFKQFHSGSAITQHLESQTNRCNARDDRRFSQIMDQVAAGMINTAGTHADNTHRYYTAQIVPKLQLDTVHEAKGEVVVNAVNDPEYRLARTREREQKLKEEKARIEALKNDEWDE
ncbi:hypothetical protein GMDG_04200 [Pseudogymnoascus destructans 20631-21]|uniref:C2H2-type domain-containing protein n=2 Tax=Pseudogymnoascus destructans TaxID=655981 RepID=L8GA16_PSED2|nr:hypothetical protein GMDG_04200 [Pseudogymnoascus destructans 20631-21]